MKEEKGKDEKKVERGRRRGGDVKTLYGKDNKRGRRKRKEARINIIKEILIRI